MTKYTTWFKLTAKLTTEAANTHMNASPRNPSTQLGKPPTDSSLGRRDGSSRGTAAQHEVIVSCRDDGVTEPDDPFHGNRTGCLAVKAVGCESETEDNSDDREPQFEFKTAGCQHLSPAWCTL